MMRIHPGPDGTHGDALALATAAKLARISGAKLVLLQVAVPIPLSLYAETGAGFATLPDPSWDEDALAGAQQYVDGLAARLRTERLQAQGRAVLGSVAETVYAVADAVQADLVVMSTHARPGPARTLLGSVADAVVRTAQHPVLLVRRPLRDGVSAAAETAPVEARGSPRPGEATAGSADARL